MKKEETYLDAEGHAVGKPEDAAYISVRELDDDGNITSQRLLRIVK